jgi:hypothetical protein
VRREGEDGEVSGVSVCHRLGGDFNLNASRDGRRFGYREALFPETLDVDRDTFANESLSLFKRLANNAETWQIGRIGSPTTVRGPLVDD